MPCKVQYSYRDGSEEKQEEAERQGASSGTQNVPLAHGRNKLKAEKPDKGKGPQAPGRLPGSRPQTCEPPRLPTRSSLPARYRWGLRPSRTSAGVPGAADPPPPSAPARRSDGATLPERPRAQRTLPSRGHAGRDPEPGTFPDQTGSRRNSRHGGPRPRHRPLARSSSKLVGLPEISRESVGPGRYRSPDSFCLPLWFRGARSPCRKVVLGLDRSEAGVRTAGLSFQPGPRYSQEARICPRWSTLFLWWRMPSAHKSWPSQKSTREKRTLYSEILNKSDYLSLGHSNFYLFCNASEQSYGFVNYMGHSFSLFKCSLKLTPQAFQCNQEITNTFEYYHLEM